MFVGQKKDRGNMRALTKEQSIKIKQAIYDLMTACHNIALSKGFWDDCVGTGDAGHSKFYPERRNMGETIALMHSELSEALEAVRHGNPPDKHIGAFDSLTVEFADLIIRVMDTCAAHNIPLDAAIIEKMEYNEGREHKHGKEF
jgi:NTP pyrophosphatase (non-canonical NTP hydrolase)